MSVPVETPAFVNRIDAEPETARSVVVITSPQADRSPRALAWPLALIVLAGIGVRFAAWSGDRDLWTDESMLALNLVSRSPAQLLEPLDWNQGAPIGFLLAMKATVSALGISERTLRLVPLLGSFAGLAGFAWLAAKWLPRSAAIFAAILFSLSPVLVSYSAECKQYATDAAIAVGLLAASTGLLQGEGGFRRWAVLALAGAAAVWCSHPAAFVLAGIGTPLFLDALLKRDRTRTHAAAAMITAWLASFSACYLLFLRKLGGNAYLMDFWTGHFLLAPTSANGVVWLLDHFFAPFDHPAGMGGTEIRAGGIAAGLFLIGLVGFVKQRKELAAALVLPGLFALAASAVHMYPFTGRLLLFLVPMLVLGAARGAGMLIDALKTSPPLAALVLPAILLAAPALQTLQELRRPPHTEQVKQVLDRMRPQMLPADRVYVYYGAAPAVEFYTRDKPLPTPHIDIGTESRRDPTAYRDQLRSFRSEPRVWIVFSHHYGHEEFQLAAYADTLGRKLEAIAAPGATATLYDFR
ncbi:MAG: hypothetical protein U0791_21930 [Gemmataceae bacterium]